MAWLGVRSTSILTFFPAWTSVGSGVIGAMMVPANIANVEVTSCFDEPEYVFGKVPPGGTTTIAVINAKVPQVFAGAYVRAGLLIVAVEDMLEVAPNGNVPEVAEKVTGVSAPGFTGLPNSSARDALSLVSLPVR